MNCPRFESTGDFVVIKTAGHILRLTGLVVEMLGVWGVYSSAGANDRARMRLADGTVIPLAWIAVGVGFMLWLTGRIIVSIASSTRKPRTLDDQDSKS
jgi:hypothetical protein